MTLAHRAGELRVLGRRPSIEHRTLRAELMMEKPGSPSTNTMHIAFVAELITAEHCKVRELRIKIESCIAKSRKRTKEMVVRRQPALGRRADLGLEFKRANVIAIFLCLDDHHLSVAAGRRIVLLQQSPSGGSSPLACSLARRIPQVQTRVLL